MPTEKAGTIGTPTGTIAFIREGSVWTIDIESGLTDEICDVPNGDGRLTWSPDGEKIVFTRSGKATMESPTSGEGGMHKLYDLFFAEVDSAYANNRLWWQRLTDDLGCRDAEWMPGGDSIIFGQDLNARWADPVSPNYQICTMPASGGEITILRKDYANATDEFLIKPSVNSRGQLAAVYFAKMKQVGLVVLGPDDYMLDFGSIGMMAKGNYQQVAPSWSHDGTWLAYVSANSDDGGLYIANADLSERYKVYSPTTGQFVYPYAPSFSPDDKWLTFSTTDGSIWICDITGNGARRLAGPGLNRAPAWAPAAK